MSNGFKQSKYRHPMRRPCHAGYVLLALVATGRASAFALSSQRATTQRKALNTLKMQDADALYLERFKRRLHQVQTTVLQEEDRRPPNPNLDPCQVVTEILNGLRDPHTPTYNFGFEVLLRSSTPSWCNLLYRSVGAPSDSSLQSVSEALESALSRPNNQFRILVGKEDTAYRITFPTDYLDYEDGTCWVECRLRSQHDDTLLVALGWSLLRQDGAWRIHGMDWQDFRDAYRPGIGREEWERICG